MVVSTTTSTSRFSLETKISQRCLNKGFFAKFNCSRDLYDTVGRRWIGRGGPLPWPACSPGLTSCDFWLWGIVKDRDYASKPRDLDDQKHRIMHAIAKVLAKMAKSALQITLDRLH
ncbi:uncharacterized protein NPIL_457591 [Nephila pilipes]|uniref:Uncharacterized protein n=1 Tax=Nephila pilipes TaxID=299642 RepID=A0A8X6PFI7_NEPPI|nr:uncharacterized protein NPIL_457591 [Nephila pilipes]